MRFAVTEKGSYQRCERQAYISSYNGMRLTPMFSPLNLSVGSLIHRAQQLWINDWNTGGERSLYLCALDAAVELEEQVKKQYAKKVGALPSDSELEVTHESIDFALSMCQNYELKWGQPLPEQYRLIAAEQKISVPVPETEHRCINCNSTGIPTRHNLVSLNLPAQCTECHVVVPGKVSQHLFEGRLDALLQHIPTGRLDILERKTYNQRPKEEVLRRNAQFIGYDYLVRRLGFNAGAGVRIAYDGMWRRKEPPRGRSFDDLFARYLLPERNTAERMEFSRFLGPTLNKMYDLYITRGSVRDTQPTIPWLGCTDCKLTELCEAISRGEEYQGLIDLKFTLRTDADEEESEG